MGFDEQNRVIDPAHSVGNALCGVPGGGTDVCFGSRNATEGVPYRPVSSHVTKEVR